jgi:hypothetical protein
VCVCVCVRVRVCVWGGFKAHGTKSLFPTSVVSH